MITSNAIMKEEPVNSGYSNKIYEFNDGIVNFNPSLFVNSDINTIGICWEIDVYGNNGLFYFM